MTASSRILVIDDDPHIRRVVERSFANEFEVMTASNGREGLEMARTHDPAVILLDIRMPVLDGYSVCRRLQEDPFTSHIPILMQTGLGEKEEMLLGLRTGADDYVIKPFDLGELRVRVRSLIRRSAGFLHSTLPPPAAEQPVQPRG